jgi:biopolymer transport protein ExbB/TolQ
MHRRGIELATSWTPFVGLGGTVAGILFTFTRIGTEPEWETVLRGVGFSLAVTTAGLIGLYVAVRGRR